MKLARTRLTSLLITAAFFICGIAGDSSAERLGDRQKRVNTGGQRKLHAPIGFKWGVVGNGTFVVDDRIQLESDGGWSAELFVDSRVSRVMSVGISADLFEISGEVLSKVEREVALDIALNTKFNLARPGSPFYFRPGVSFGLGNIDKLPVNGESAYGLSNRMFAEVGTMITDEVGLLAETGYWSVLTGTSNDVSFSDGSRVYFRLGLMFGQSLYRQKPSELPK